MSRELEEALRELALEIAQCYATIEQQKAVMRQAVDRLDTARFNEADPVVRQHYTETITALREALED